MGWQSWKATTTSARDRDGWKAFLNGRRCPAGHDEDEDDDDNDYLKYIFSLMKFHYNLFVLVCFCLFLCVCVCVYFQGPKQGACPQKLLNVLKQVYYYIILLSIVNFFFGCALVTV